jgi:hypothetical protein
MNDYNPFVCNWSVEEKKAANMSIAGLVASIADCQECIDQGVNPEKYYDQIAVYRKELEFRKFRKELQSRRAKS